MTISTAYTFHCDRTACPANETFNAETERAAIEQATANGWESTTDGERCPQCTFDSEAGHTDRESNSTPSNRITDNAVTFPDNDD